jgi:hypothetical protein
MVKQMSFKGMRLRTRAQRRALVIGYYSVLLAVGVAGLVRPGQRDVVALINFGFFSCLLLGGIYGRGPVKSYEEPMLPLEAGRGLSMWDNKGDEVQELGLSGPKPKRDDGGSGDWEPLDEREKTERDHAHYEAYRILRWTVGIAVVAYWASLHWTYPSNLWLNAKLPVLAMVLLVYVLSLPQAVVLWTEPEDVDAT